ncbi:MAG: TetR/AcrR family transcriptional regulator [Pseudomonadota bacterium]
MPRPRSHSRDTLIVASMQRFWTHGYHATSMDDLVKATGVSRGSIYADFEGKRDLFLCCLSRYQDEVVTPAFAQVEQADAGLETIEAYLLFQLSHLDDDRLPGPGCLVANTMTELGPHDRDIHDAVNAHNVRLQNGFYQVLKRANKSTSPLSPDQLGELAVFLTMSVQGLWSFSRSAESVEPLRQYARTLVDLVKSRLR